MPKTILSKLAEAVEALTFTEAVEQDEARQQAARLTGAVFDLTYALGRSIESILVDPDATDKAGLIGAAVEEFRSAIPTVKAAGQPDPGDVHQGGKGKKKKPAVAPFLRTMGIAKIDAPERNVFGFFSVVEIDGEAVVDKQDDIIEADVLEKAAYGFVLDARIAGEAHDRLGVGKLIESVVFTKEKQEAIVKSLSEQGIEAALDLGSIGWWGGFHITDDDVWKSIENGKYTAFSIGGTATSEPVGDDGKTSD